MSHTPNTILDPIPLACPSCGSAEHLHTVEVVEVLVEARFALGQAQPETGEGSQLLADTQHWQPDTGAIVCRNCDQVDLRYRDLIPAISLVDQSMLPARVPTPGATS